ncbi:hypothetical protein E2C01_057222 [Portunus trituberculatus]|uniref:Uncharacterized protein n=1 Tax=Portunus trituberculatus TaxID=210409 RepID=A0A5B7H1S3_PORTR|nr:hypothetical protein [Portunus trituberculatus]
MERRGHSSFVYVFLLNEISSNGKPSHIVKLCFSPSSGDDPPPYVSISSRPMEEEDNPALQY